jgi:hypothetical protein
MNEKMTKWPQNLPTSSFSTPSKMYPNWDFWVENIPRGTNHSYLGVNFPVRSKPRLKIALSMYTSDYVCTVFEIFVVMQRNFLLLASPHSSSEVSQIYINAAKVTREDSVTNYKLIVSREIEVNPVCRKTGKYGLLKNW